jgi:hypothetical protein
MTTKQKAIEQTKEKITKILTYFNIFLFGLCVGMTIKIIQGT